MKIHNTTLAILVVSLILASCDGWGGGGGDGGGGGSSGGSSNAIKATALNDTGIDWGGDYPGSNNSDCSGQDTTDSPAVNLPPQDCNQGRDSTHNDDSDGHAGFSFTKLEANRGNELSASSTSWSCVRDNVTGLVWEVKVATGSVDSTADIQKGISKNIHHKDNLYRWGGITAIGRDDVTNGERIYDYDDWNTLVTGSNDASLCGYSDWRAPKRHELRSIVDYSRVNPSIDTNYFPNTPSAGFWSASPYADYNADAWHVSFYYGYDSFHYSHYRHRTPNRLRLVRGGQ